MPNSELAWATYALIEKFPEQLDMSDWIRDRTLFPSQHGEQPALSLDGFTGRCRTTACMAGWTVLAAGEQLTLNGKVITADGLVLCGMIAVDLRAQYLLRIDDDASEELFYHTLESDLEQRITIIFGPRPERTHDAER